MAIRPSKYFSPTVEGMGRKNLLINGNFDVWQRGTVFASTSASQYLADRWLHAMSHEVYAGRYEFALGQTDVPGNPLYYMHTSVHDNTVGEYANLHQRIEGVHTLSGETVTLSFWLNTSGGQQVGIGYRQFFGTGGTPSDHLDANIAKVSTSGTGWEKFTLTFTVPSILGKTLGTDGNDYFGIWFIWSAAPTHDPQFTMSGGLGVQDGTFRVAQIQLEKGQFATEFERRSYGEELQLCQRYYEESYFYFSIGNISVVSGNIGISQSWLVRKRVTPSITHEISHGGTLALVGKVGAFRAIMSAGSQTSTSGTVYGDAEL